MNRLMIYSKEIDDNLGGNKAEETDDAHNQIAEDISALQDSDDEKVCASVQSKSMLKKNEDEDIISSDQYEKRLGQQSEKLYPTPNWVTAL
ncbi:16923_t:CDS:2 [Gigaspora rosea]|nr:16923_t:CDS:2 [Gigaspora rosea]